MKGKIIEMRIKKKKKIFVK